MKVIPDDDRKGQDLPSTGHNHMISNNIKAISIQGRNHVLYALGG